MLCLLRPAAAQDQGSLPAVGSQSVVADFFSALTSSQTAGVNADQQRSPAAKSSSGEDTDLWHKLTRIGIAFATIGLGILSVMAALRGVIKGSIEVRLWRKSIKRFSEREFTDTASCNVHSLIERDGKLVLEADTLARPLLDEFMGNRGARRYFLRAAQKCTHDQPLIYLEFPRDLEKKKIRRTTMRTVGRPLYYLTFKNLFNWAVEPLSPNLERFKALNRINKILREAVSATYNQSNMGLIAKQFSKEVPYDFIEKQIVVVPICDVSRPEEKQRRTLILATLSLNDFKKFGIPKEYARMDVADGIPQEKLETLKRAYDEYQSYLQYKSRGGDQQELFPKVRVYIPRPSNLPKS